MAREVRFSVVPGPWPGARGGHALCLGAGMAPAADTVLVTPQRRAAGERRVAERRRDSTRCLSCRRKVTRRRGDRRAGAGG